MEKRSQGAMIHRIIWPKPRINEPANPFLLGSAKRPLRFTLHSESFLSATRDDSQAIDILRRFSQHSRIEVVDTSPSDLPRLEVAEFHLERENIDVYVNYRDHRTTAIVQNSGQWYSMAQRIAGENELANPVLRSMLDDIILARAHCALRRDILITCSDRLLTNRQTPFIEEANPCTPLEAVKILGLFLRSQSDYTIEMIKKGTHYIHRDMFYGVLARHRLPYLWKYFSACVFSDKIRGDGISGLGESILSRCSRALEARDSIGISFYCPESNITREGIMYHFDYLMLLLAGAIDAQARVARRVYGIEKPNDHNTSFRYENFIEVLGRQNATELGGIASSQEFIDLMTLIVELRNTIHGANLRTFQSCRPPRARETYVALNDGHAEIVWEAACRYRTPDDWGLRRTNKIFFEPYSYASTAIHECFRMINRIAHATDVVRLFPEGEAPYLLSQPPETGGFEKWMRKRIHALG